MKHTPWSANTGQLKGPSGAEAETNAHLIAAAPEMLEALKALVEDEHSRATPQIIGMVRAAIRKAEGGA